MKRLREKHPALEKPRQPGRVRAFILAVIVHAAFFGLIVFGVTWQSSPTAPVVAELWDKIATPKPAEVKKSEPPPKPKVEPKPEPKPEPPKPEPPKPEPEPPEPEPPKAEVKPPPPDPAVIEKLEREKREKERVEREKREKEKLERERQEKQKKEELRKKREEEEAARRKKQEEERRRAEEERLRREAERAQQEAMTRKQAQIAGYIEKIKAKIRGVANIPDTVRGNPEVHVRVRILPGGEVLEATVVKPSGNRAYDMAIERAIRSAQPLPVPPADSELFPQFRDLILHIRHER